jgi:hypothetical protein
METFRLALIDNDSQAQASLDLVLDSESADALSAFITGMKEELVIGQTECLEIEGARNDTVRLAVSQSE